MKRYNLSNVFKIKSESVRHKLLNKYTINKYDKRAFLNNVEKLEEQAESGGLVEKDCNFYDYDGTLLYSYTAEEALALTKLPPLPTKKGLICIGWNWSLEDIYDCINQGGFCDVGCLYKTDDDTTRYYIDIPFDDYYINCNMGVGYKLDIDWGDGVRTDKTYHYYKKGKYIIKVYNASYFTGWNASINDVTYKCVLSNVLKVAVKCKYIILPDTFTNESYSSLYVDFVVLPNTSKGIYISGSIKKFSKPYKQICNINNANISRLLINSNSNSGSYTGCTINKVMIINCTSISSKAFYQTKINKLIILPNSIKINYDAFDSSIINNQEMYQKLIDINSNNSGLSFTNSSIIGKIDLTKYTNIYNSKFSYSYLLNEIILNDEVTNIPNSFVAYCRNFRKIKLPNKLTNISSYAFSNISNLFLKIPNSITSISSNPFDDSYGSLDFSDLDHIVTLTVINNNFIINRIIVPDNLYDEWIVATNWANISDRIIKASEYESNQQ